MEPEGGIERGFQLNLKLKGGVVLLILDDNGYGF